MTKNISMTKTTALFTYNKHMACDASCSIGHMTPWVRHSGERVEVVENPECDNERSQVRDSYYDQYAEYAVVFPGEECPKYYVFKSELSDFQEVEVCHCGKLVHTYPDGFTRGLCMMCNLERCDAPVEDYRYDCQK